MANRVRRLRHATSGIVADGRRAAGSARGEAVCGRRAGIARRSSTGRLLGPAGLEGSAVETGGDLAADDPRVVREGMFRVWSA